MTHRNSTDRTTDHLVASRLDRRHFLFAVAGVPVLAAALAACGDPDAQSGDTTPMTGPASGPTTGPTTGPVTEPATTTPDLMTPSLPVTSAASEGPAGGTAPIEHPRAADQVVMWMGHEGGYVPVGFNFQHLPDALVAGDGRLYRPGVQTAIYPGALLPAVEASTLTEADVQQVLAAADRNGLLTLPVPSYDADVRVTDVPDTVVELRARGAVFRHVAPALGMNSPDGGAESTPARVALLAFTTEIQQLLGAGTIGTEPAVFAATSFRLQARPVTMDQFADQEPAPTVRAWPGGTGVALTDAADCRVVTGDAVATVLRDANTLSLFTEAGLTYQLSAAPLLPGDAC
jgi:hypothetical protein